MAHSWHSVHIAWSFVYILFADISTTWGNFFKKTLALRLYRSEMILLTLELGWGPVHLFEMIVPPVEVKGEEKD